jgi:hypothetical protein
VIQRSCLESRFYVARTTLPYLPRIRLYSSARTCSAMLHLNVVSDSSAAAGTSTGAGVRLRLIKGNCKMVCKLKDLAPPAISELLLMTGGCAAEGIVGSIVEWLHQASSGPCRMPHSTDACPTGSVRSASSNSAGILASEIPVRYFGEDLAGLVVAGAINKSESSAWGEQARFLQSCPCCSAGHN